MRAYGQKRRKEPALPGLFLGLCLLVVSIPGVGNVSTHASPPLPVSISAYAHNFVLLPVSSRGYEQLNGLKPGRNEAFRRKLSAQEELTSYLTREHSSGGAGPFRLPISAGIFGSVFVGVCQQAYLLLDLPPPPGIFS